MAALVQDDEYVTNFDSAEHSDEHSNIESKFFKKLGKNPKHNLKNNNNVIKKEGDNNIDMKVENFSDILRIIKKMGLKYNFRTNLKHGTLVGGILIIFIFIFIRNCSIFKFFIISLFPILYGLFGSRTFALGDLKDKVVLITGASSGLGRGLAIEATKQGAKKVILVARSMKGLEETSKLCRMSYQDIKGDCNITSLCISCDVTSYNDIQEKIIKTIENDNDIGTVNLLINCAGSGDWKPILNTTPDEALKHITCPYLAAFNMTRALLPSMISGGGQYHVMNVTSAAAYTGWKGSASYGSARWAVRGFTEYLRCEVKEYGIGVTLLNPGQIRGTEYGNNNMIDFEHLPWIFKKGYNNPRAYDCEMVSTRALRGCTDGECEVHVPGFVAHTSTWLTALVPSVVWFMIDMKPYWVKDGNKEEKKENMESKKDN